MTEITASCGPPCSASLSSLTTSSGSCLNTKLTSAAGLSVFGGEDMASFLIEFGAVVVRFQARQQQSDGLVSFGLVSFGLVSFGQVSFGSVPDCASRSKSGKPLKNSMSSAQNKRPMGRMMTVPRNELVILIIDAL